MPKAVLKTMFCQVSTIVLKAASSPFFNCSTNILSSKPVEFKEDDITEIFFGLIHPAQRTQFFPVLEHRAPVPSLKIIDFCLAKISQAVSKRQHKVLLQHLALRVFDIIFSDGPYNTLILL